MRYVPSSNRHLPLTVRRLSGRLPNKEINLQNVRSRDRPSSSSASEAHSSDSVGRTRSLETETTAVASIDNSDEYTPVASEPLARRPRITSAVSAPSAVPPKPRKPARSDEPQGLTLIHSPETGATADIIFIHGLGGSSRLTWSNNHDLDLFWPAIWLPKDNDIGQARLFTFGYNADFRAASQSNSLGITDFSNNLLYDMLYGSDRNGCPFEFGQAPIIIVAHSMGGLVFKKAYLEAQLDDRYKNITRSIKAVLFLATPHRGAHLAESLNRLLSVSFRNAPKQYVAELAKNGIFVKNINEQFRHSAPKLQIFSFNESLQTSLGVGSSMVIEEDSARLGYPGEISRSLNADHHGVCKFDSPDDANYGTVLAALKSVVTSHSRADTQSAGADLIKVRAMLNISDNFDHDLAHFSGWRTEGHGSPPLHQICYGSGRPARGKSVLTSYVINNLREKGATVQYFLFRNGNETKRSITALLRSLAYQIAAQLPAFRKALADIADGGYKPREADWKSLWKKLYSEVLFRTEICPPFYWVIDGLDESVSSQQPAMPIHILLASGLTPVLSASFTRFGDRIPAVSASIDQDLTDIQVYVEEELRYLGWDDQIKEDIRSRVLDQAHNNFLWVHLILEEIKECHTDDDIRDALLELPKGMESLYRKMEDSIPRIRKPSDRNLSRQLLLWAIYSRRSISIQELSAILEPEFGHILDMPTAIKRLCGHFLVIEGQHQIELIHQTAREYLTTSSSLPFSLASSDAHLVIFQKSLLLSTRPTPIQYRATSWMHHLRYLGSMGDNDDILDLLLRFFQDTSVLTWIHTLALLNQLKSLIDAAHCLEAFVKKRRRVDAGRETLLRRFEDLELLDLWSRDMLKLPGRFGNMLSKDPACIHHYISLFCPRSSAIHATFGCAVLRPVVQGLPEDWDDCLVRISWKYLAVVGSVGDVLIFDCTTFHRTMTLHHGETISAICFNSTGDQIVSYGSATTKVWSCQTGVLQKLVNNILGMQALCLEFAAHDKALVLGSDRRSVLRVSLDQAHEGWTVIDSSLLNSVESGDGTYLNSPTALAISPDRTKIAAAYRRFPLIIWSMDPTRVLMRIGRVHKRGVPSNASPFVKQMAWHPNGEDMVGFFVDGYVFKLNILDSTYQAHPPDPGQWPSIIRFNSDGSVYTICSVHGTIRLYDFQTSTMIYQLTSENSVSSFTFSQDGRRFYDTRGNSCQVWEPNALVRLGVNDEKPASSHTPDESVEQSNYPSETFEDNPIPIDIVAPMPGQSVVAFGDEEGLIALLDLETRARWVIDRTATGLSVEHLTWSKDGNYLLYAEVSGRLTLLQIEPLSTGYKPKRVERFKPKHEAGGIIQLILAPDSKSVLVVYHGSAQLWSLMPPRLQDHQGAQTPAGTHWAPHPLSQQHILALTPGAFFVMDRLDMNETSCTEGISHDFLRQLLIGEMSSIPSRIGAGAKHIPATAQSQSHCDTSYPSNIQVSYI
ncbi:hypothetical protein F5Y16DRAFT_409521 [Xylariaceae sp. FL0255]|nr:hypothetical protein F5Y16DRAFT_409521 [Xylariaceae sp. FL0255]